MTSQNLTSHIKSRTINIIGLAIILLWPVICVKSEGADGESEGATTSKLWKYIPENWPTPWQFRRDNKGNKSTTRWILMKGYNSENVLGPYIMMELNDEGTVQEAKDRTMGQFRSFESRDRNIGFKVKRFAGSDEFSGRTESLNLPGKGGFILQHESNFGDSKNGNIEGQIYQGIYVLTLNTSDTENDIDTVRQLVSLIDLPSTEQPAPSSAQASGQPAPVHPTSPYLPIGAAFMALAALASFLRTRIRNKNLGQGKEVSGHDTHSSGLVSAVAGAFTGLQLKDLASSGEGALLDKLRLLGTKTVFEHNRNLVTGRFVSGGEFAKRLTLTGKAGMIGSGVLAVGTQGLEFWEIWKSRGSWNKKQMKAGISLGVNAFAITASTALVGLTAPTVVGTLVGFAGSVVIGGMAEATKTGLYQLVDKYYPY